MRRCDSTNRSTQHSGFTLVEALIAIIILLIGVAAAIRIFPRGYELISRTTQATIAQEQVKRFEAELFTHPDNLPEAILPVDGPQVVLDNFRWNDLSTVSFHPQSTSAYRQYLFPADTGVWPLWQPLSARVLRRVVGERCQIPSEFSAGAGGTVSFIPSYLPRFGPLEAGQTIDIYDLRYRKVSKDELDKLKERQAQLPDGLYYAVDYATGTVSLLPGTAARRIRVAYYYIDTATNAITREQRVVAAGGESITLSAPGNGMIIPGSEQLNRAYQPAPGITPGDMAAIANLESGQFYVEAGASGSLLLGAIFFAKADAGRAVKIDYTIADWNILHEDVMVDGDGYFQLSLTPKMRNRPSGTREPRTWGLYEPMVNGSTVMALVHVGSGAIAEVRVDDPSLIRANYTFTLGGSSYTLQADPDLRSRWQLRKAAGTGSNTEYAGQSFRVFYRATRDWTLQFFRPPARFWSIQAGGATLDALKSQQLGWDAFSWATISNQAWLALPAVYAGQSVAIDYQWRDASVEPARLRRISGELHTIPPADAEKPSSIVMLRQTPAPGTMVTVRGASVMVRALWVQPRRGRVTAIDEAGNFKTGAMNERWESVRSITIVPASEE